MHDSYVHSSISDGYRRESKSSIDLMAPSRRIAMRTAAVLVTFFCGPLASPIASGAESDILGLRPGLWQFEITYQSLNGRQVLDGRDLVARVLAAIDPVDLALDRENLALAHSPCESGGAAQRAVGEMEKADQNMRGRQAPCDLENAMRARAESSSRENGANLGATASFSICLTPELVRLRTPILDADNRCHPTAVSQSGRHMKFRFSCASEGVSMIGEGDAHRSLLGRILTGMDFDVQIKGGQHFAVHDDTQMKFISPDCGNVKPPGP